MYRKFTASQLFNGYSLLKEGQVLITSENGIVEAIVNREDAGEDIQHLEGLLTPGFVNAHCHLELSHMKGHIPERTGLVEFLLKVIKERNFTDSEVQAAIELAEEEMLQNGIVAVGDICNTNSTVAQKKLQRLLYYNFIEVSGVSAAIALQRFENGTALRGEFENVAASSIVPHAPYSVSPELFALINQAATAKTLSIHNQESMAEDELFRLGTGDFIHLFEALSIDPAALIATGKSSFQSCLPRLTQPHNLVLVHDVFTSVEDLAFANQLNQQHPVNLFFCLCPNANLYISGELPNVPLLSQTTDWVVLGTDSLASNHQLSILEEMKTLQLNYPDLSTATVLQWATINGARALQLDSKLGSFEKSKQPGIVLIETQGDQSLVNATRSTRIL